MTPMRTESDVPSGVTMRAESDEPSGEAATRAVDDSHSIMQPGAQLARGS